MKIDFEKDKFFAFNRAFYTVFYKRNKVLYRILFATVQPISWLVTIIFWMFISKDLFKMKMPYSHKFFYSMQHILNLVLPSIDLIFFRIGINFCYCVFPVLIMILYSIMLITLKFKYSKNLPYTFLEGKFTLSYYVSFSIYMIILTMIIYTVIYKIARKRMKIKYYLPK